MKYFISLLFTIILLSSFSQNLKKVHVVDENKKAIPFVHIRFSDGKGLTSDANGRFILNKDFSTDSVLSISHIAFEPRQINTSLINDTICLTPKRYYLNEIVITNANIRKILATALSNVNYNAKRNYFSTRFQAIGDSLVSYTEKSFKLIKVESKKIKIRIYSDIYYNVSPKREYNINFPFIATLESNPYWRYKSKELFNELVANAFIEKEYDSFYKLKSVTDSTDITMYVSKLNTRLLRFEKIIAPYKEQSIQIDTTYYSYEFELENKNTIIIKSFKYQTVIYDKIDSIVYPTRSYISDILVKKIVNRDSLSFSSLKELRAYKKNQELIDVDLYYYFHKRKTQGNKENKEVASILGFKKLPNDTISDLKNTTILDSPKFKIKSYSKEYKLRLPKTNYYLALYNQATLSYDYYPSKTKVQFDLNSVNSNSKIPNLIKKDSFNPYGVSDPKTSIFMGVINTFLNKIQK